jgi:hypothetical protein
MKMLHHLLVWLDVPKLSVAFPWPPLNHNIFVCVFGQPERVMWLPWPFGYVSALQIQASAQRKALEASACWNDFFYR